MQPSETPKPILAAVTEVLQTERGTTFYVLTVAGEYGVPEDAEGEDKDKEAGADKGDDEPLAVGGAFVTEVPPAEKEGAEEEEEEEFKPEYISCVDIPLSDILEVKKT